MSRDRVHVPPVAVHSVAAARAQEPGLRIADIRDHAEFALGHLPRAGHIPVAELGLRRMELPSRKHAVLVVHDRPEFAHDAALMLSARGYERVLWLECPLAEEPSGHGCTEPAARLWSASPFLERALSGAPRGHGRALDLACGSGRAAVHLAQAKWRVEAWDIDSSALELAEGFARRQGVRIATRLCDLEAAALPDPDPAFDAIVVIRYLHRELFPWIERALAPGGALVYETFRVGQEQFGHPRRPRHLLEPGELTRAFPSLRVEIHEESPEHEPPVMARVLAFRPE